VDSEFERFLAYFIASLEYRFPQLAQRIRSLIGDDHKELLERSLSIIQGNPGGALAESSPSDLR
jgi:hypothetical protein